MRPSRSLRIRASDLTPGVPPPRASGGARFMLEYQKAEDALKAWGVHSTIVVFGSARVRPDGPGKQAGWYQAARDFELRQDSQSWEHALDDHSHVRARLSCGDDGEQSLLVHPLANRH